MFSAKWINFEERTIDKKVTARMKSCLAGLILLLSFCEVWTDEKSNSFTWDENGYLIFCLCMGRFGNQADHFLGGLSFAKKINRTLVLPPWRTYKNIPFTDFFQYEPVTQYHRVILAEDFMEHLAPTYWPIGQRIGMCYNSPNRPSECQMKEGNPFGPFWDGLGVDFDKTETYSFSYGQIGEWNKRFPVDSYPVIALRGAPARYPVVKADRQLQKYLIWSDNIVETAHHYIYANFPDEKFLGIHLRNNIDWKNACNHAEGRNEYMSSPQCLDPRSGENVTLEMCYPSNEGIIKSVKSIIKSSGLKVIYVATDKNPLIEEFKSELAEFNVRIFHQDPWLPQIDLYTLGQAEIFIGNCVSSFTAFVTRERAVNNKTSLFWGLI